MMNSLAGKHILLGVTGGIAAYKAVSLLRTFQKLEAEVRVIMTPSASSFIGVETFKALSKNDVPIHVFTDNPSQDWTRHIHWAEWADLFLIAPCTANTLAKITHGLSDNSLTATVLAARCPLMVCPTMDGEMYTAPSTQRNLSILKDMGIHILEPEEGYLASGLIGKGRLPDESIIVEEVQRLIHSYPALLKGQKVVVTAGATREFLDPVRFLSNPSTGKMGVAMAKAAQALGADVTLIHAHMSVPVPKDMHTRSVTSAQDLFEAIQDHKADAYIMAAAVSDYTPVEVSKHKVKKSEEELTLSFKKTVDILHWLGENRTDSIRIGFAMETENLRENGLKKLSKKHAHAILANALNEDGSGFAHDTNSIEVIDQSHTYPRFSGKKEEIALSILSYLAPLFENPQKNT